MAHCGSSAAKARGDLNGARRSARRWRLRQALAHTKGSPRAERLVRLVCPAATPPARPVVLLPYGHVVLLPCPPDHQAPGRREGADDPARPRRRLPRLLRRPRRHQPPAAQPRPRRVNFKKMMKCAEEPRCLRIDITVHQKMLPASNFACEFGECVRPTGPLLGACGNA